MGGLPRDQDKCPALNQLFRESLSEKMYTRQSWKIEGSMDMINTLFLTTVAVESNLLLLLFFIAIANLRPGLDLSCHSFKYSEERWPQNQPQYLSGLSSALPFPTASLEITVDWPRVCWGTGNYLSPGAGAAEDFRGNHLIFMWTKRGISRNWELKGRGSQKTLERFRGEST